jgi:bacterioferritin
VRVCAEARDDGSKALFESMIRDEERHADFLEAQLYAINEMGVANYFAQQMGGSILLITHFPPKTIPEFT